MKRTKPLCNAFCMPTSLIPHKRSCCVQDSDLDDSAPIVMLNTGFQCSIEDPHRQGGCFFVVGFPKG